MILAERVPEHTPAGNFPGESAQDANEMRSDAVLAHDAASHLHLPGVSGNAAPGPPRDVSRK